MPTGCDDVDDGHDEPVHERLVEVRELAGVAPSLAVVVNVAEWPGRDDRLFVADERVCASAGETKATYVAWLRATAPTPASTP
jgi:hypothetical protein